MDKFTFEITIVARVIKQITENGGFCLDLSLRRYDFDKEDFIKKHNHNYMYVFTQLFR